MATKIGNWTDEPCYYVDCTDAGKVALLLGPFRAHQDALDMVEKVMHYAPEIDAKAHFYSYGTLKMANGYRDGVLNRHYSPDKWTGEAIN